MTTTTDFSEATPGYEAGYKQGVQWVKGGGSLTADGPADTDEDFFNGFNDCLADERRRVDAEASRKNRSSRGQPRV